MVNQIIVQMLLFSPGILLHIFSVYILHLAKKTSLQNTQRLFFMHLSISEILIQLFAILRRVGRIYQNDDMIIYMNLAQAGFSFIVYYLVMIFITLDRFFIVYLNIQYPLFWCDQRTKYLITFTWCLAAGTLVTCFLLKPKETFLMVYFYPVFGLICILIAVLCYSYIFCKIYNNKKQDRLRAISVTSSNNNETPPRSRSGTTTTQNINQQGAISIINDYSEPPPPKVRADGKLLTHPFVTLHTPPLCMRKTNISNIDHAKKYRFKGFHSAILIFLTFALFVILPDQIFLYYSIRNTEMPRLVRTMLTLMYVVAYVSDFFIYILASKPIRKMMNRKMTKKRKTARKPNNENIQLSIITKARL